MIRKKGKLMHETKQRRMARSAHLNLELHDVAARRGADKASAHQCVGFVQGANVAG